MTPNPSNPTQTEDWEKRLNAEISAREMDLKRDRSRGYSGDPSFATVTVNLLDLKAAMLSAAPTQSPGMSELRGLLEKATKGPWITHRLFPDRIVPESHALRPVGGAEGEAADRDDYALVIAWPRDDRHGRSNGRANAALIAAAVSSLPTLLDDLAAAQGETERLREAGEGALATMRRVADDVLSDQANDPTGTMWITVTRSCRELSEALRARSALTLKSEDGPL